MGKTVQSSFRTASRSSCRSCSERSKSVVFKFGGDSGVEDNDNLPFSIDGKAYS